MTELGWTFFMYVIVTYAMMMTVKSSQFHGSLKKVNGTIQNPLANIFIADSKV